MSKRFEKPTSDQDFFNKAWEWLITDATPSCRDEEGKCRYRRNEKPEDDTCIIGAFIPDDIYLDIKSAVENSSALHMLSLNLEPYDKSYFEYNKDIARKIRLFRNIFDYVSKELVSGVQHVHDRQNVLIEAEPGYIGATRKSKMIALAERFNLALPNP
jgi:hypothetical protein